MSEAVMVQPVFLIYAFRYALGRMTYAVGQVADALEVNADHLTSDWRGQIVRDIDAAVAANRAGMDGDVRRWLELREAMIRAGISFNGRPLTRADIDVGRLEP